jgi:Cu+-exporting ATPase
MLRAFGRHGFYLKNADVIERMASLDAVVFDKTGTITHGSSSDVKFDGSLSGTELGWIKQITSASTHPLSNLVSRSISQVSHDTMVNFKEFPGRGIQAEIDGSMIKIGSAAFTGFQKFISDANSKVFVSINDEARGYFSVGSSIRKPIAEMVKSLGKKCVALLSGDNDYDREKMKELFPAETQLNFNQSPHDKLNFIRNLQEKGKQVMMIGDGLNDSGALKQSNVGIAVTDDTGIFTPACDGILRGDKIGILDKFLKLSKTATMIVKTGFGISFFYNVIALSFAVSGHLTPLVAAILMPVSSISVVGFTTLAVSIAASRRRI